MEQRKRKGLKLNILFAFLSVALMWGVWLVAYFIVQNDYVIPSFSDTVAEMGKNFISPVFWRAFANTLGRTVLAWLAAFALAAVFASLSVLWPPLYRLFAPVVSLLRTLPTMVITLMLLIWTTPRVAPLIVCLLMIFPLAFSQITAAYRGIDLRLIEMAKVYNIPFKKKLFDIYIPLMLPDIFSQAGADLSLALKVMISAEVLSTTFRSVGGLLYEASMYSQMADMFAITIVMIAAGGLLEFLVGRLTLITDVWVKGRSGAKGERQ